jgi:hypothetical protein
MRGIFSRVCRPAAGRLAFLYRGVGVAERSRMRAADECSGWSWESHSDESNMSSGR